MQKRWKITSIPVNRCDRLPMLRQPKGYVCILHDMKTGNHLIDCRDQPKYLVKYWSKSPKRYRLVRIVRADRAVDFKKYLHQRYKKSWIRNHPGWFRLDSAQLRDLDHVIAQSSRQFDVDSEQLERWNLKYFAGDFYKHLPKLRLPSGYIYVLKDQYTEDYKIGYTNHPLKRIKYLEEKASGEVEFVHILQSERVKETEAFLHKRYASFKTRPLEDWEWFRLDNPQLQEIQHLAQQRPRSSQAPANGQSSGFTASPMLEPAVTDPAFSEPAQPVSPDTQPSNWRLSNAQHTNRGRRMLVYFLAIALILAAAILVFMRFYTDVFAIG